MKEQRLPKKAVIFDFDGTLADTMEDNFKAWQRAFADHGIAIEAHHYYPLEGLPVPEVPVRLGEILGVAIADAADLAKRKEKYYRENNHFALYPGVEELIGQLKAKGIPMAVVTAGLLSRLQYTTPKGFLETFNAVITCEDTQRGKPFPDPYLKGAGKLNIAPSDCIVVENAPIGIESAKSAGAYCIALCTTLEPPYLQQADEIVKSFSDLKSSARIQKMLAQ